MATKNAVRMRTAKLGSPRLQQTLPRERLFALPRPVVLVFDNLEQAALPWLPHWLAIAVAEAPPGVCLLLTSRHRPPPELAAAIPCRRARCGRPGIPESGVAVPGTERLLSAGA